MSSTNRGGQRHASDYYITPAIEIERFLSAFLHYYEIGNPEKLTWFDPCAGGGVQITHSKRTGTMTSHNNPMAYPCVIRNKIGAEDIYTMDKRDDSAAQIIGSYIELFDKFDSKGNQTEWQQDKTHIPVISPDIIITNPPFSHAQQIIEQALEDVDDNGFVIMLLRLNFFGSKQRESLFQNSMPESIFVHSRRMSFTPDNGTDSVEYAHFVWRKNLNPESAALFHLSPKPQECAV